MSFVKNTQPNRMRKASKRVLLGETREEEAARLEKEIAAHPVTRCEPGERGPSSSRPGWSSNREEDNAEGSNEILIFARSAMLGVGDDDTHPSFSKRLRRLMRQSQES